MTLSIPFTLGWWVLPLIVTLYVIWRINRYCANRGRRGDYDFQTDVMICVLAGLVAILAAWVPYLIAALAVGIR